MRRFLPLLLLLAVVASAVVAAPARATWPFPNFSDNIEVTATPALPTQEQAVTIQIRSLNSTVFIKGATVYLRIVSPDGLGQGPYPYPMAQGVDPLHYSFTVPAYPNGTAVSYYIVAWDFDNDVITSTTYTYTVQGTPVLGWRHAGFEQNVLVAVDPPIPEPRDPVTVSIRSREPNVAIYGANLYLKYVYQTEPPQAGGFTMSHVNSTDLAATIPGFPPGTSVVFWVVAWDKNVATITSPFYYYNLTVDIYTRHETTPFPQIEAYVGASLGLALLVPVSLYYWDVRRTRKGAR